MPRGGRRSSITCCGVGVLARQHPVTRGHEDDLAAQRLVGAGELGAGDAGPDHDQSLRAAPARSYSWVQVRIRSPSGDRRRRAPAGGHRWRPAPRPPSSPAPSRRRGRPRPGAARRAGPAPRRTVTPSAARWRSTSSDWARASAWTRRVDDRARSTLVSRRTGHRARGSRLDLVHHVGDGDQRLARDAVGEHRRPAQTVAVDEDVTSAPSWAATNAASYPPGPPPMITMRATPPFWRTAASPRPGRPYASAHGALRRVRQQHGPPADAARAPHSPMTGTGWLTGWRLTFGGEDLGWEGSLATVVEDPGQRLRRPLRPHRRRRARPGLLGGSPRRVPQDPSARRHPGRRPAGLAVRARRVRRGTAVGSLPGHHRRRC